ncbi:MAG: 3-keto-5-aminohexanoate cleavage protein [Candidatus Dormibacteraeota bacterium]|uniref:3-keto-5-aminohexanoate cleavage protein n=1 Tax=Candidatus Aeolococcus gillhamiae TaxID=3127015 RepID=A0A934JZ07_9BACT|nr:3-keto-5-aminohexanoate cleavage protein [Candidatus Dormibacteraeota bacterium]
MTARTALLQVAINGQRSEPHIPRTPADLATSARDAVAAGARVVHLHPCDDHGTPTLDAQSTAAAITAVRAACPGIALSLTTWALIDPDPAHRRRLIGEWTQLPDLVTANQGEPGIGDLCHELLARGVGIEAGLLELADAHTFVSSGLAAHCTRVLLEPLDTEPDVAVAHAAAMEEVLALAGITLPQVHHGDGIASWAVNERGLRRGHGMRTGLEDTLFLPDGRPALDNAALVEAAVQLMAEIDIKPV